MTEPANGRALAMCGGSATLPSMAARKPAPLTIERYVKLARDRRNSEGLTRDLDHRKAEIVTEAAQPYYLESVDDEWV